ncbi:hypothetical protein BFL38_08990 [Brachyspira hampsonii]|uniref:Lipoprotein n=1 Tax=Brachyspira hampsonii TaxID=1287055 RepID=A0A1E5NFP1_9SPIR|nr:hypothetical protein [Brachyspira hampsonii]OEJ14956.1 hypothetical protein BFL38_08990 [Brachyspira hampsonii]
MKKILTFLLILSNIIFVGCGNNVTNSDSTTVPGDDSQNLQKPDGLSSTHDGTWYFYSEDGSVNGDTVTIANGGITGLKTSSGTAIDFVKDNFNSKFSLLDSNPIGEKNYVVYKDGYTGNMNFNTDVGYLKIRDASSGSVVMEGMLSKTQKTTTIDNTYTGTYTATKGNSTTIKINVTSTLVTLTITSSSIMRNYKIPAAYFTKSGHSYTSTAMNYPNTVLNFDTTTTTFTIQHVNVNYSASDANFTKVSSSSGSPTTISTSADTYTKGQ